MSKIANTVTTLQEGEESSLNGTKTHLAQNLLIWYILQIKYEDKMQNPTGPNFQALPPM